MSGLLHWISSKLVYSFEKSAKLVLALTSAAKPLTYTNLAINSLLNGCFSVYSYLKFTSLEVVHFGATVLFGTLSLPFVEQNNVTITLLRLNTVEDLLFLAADGVAETAMKLTDANALLFVNENGTETGLATV